MTTPRIALLEQRGAVRLEQMRYRTIVVDPPWEYRQKFAGPGKATSFWTKNRRAGKGAAAAYGCMTQAELLVLPLQEWSDDNAHLYLWTTNQFMIEAHELAAAWGFQVKTILTWVKRGIRMGFYFRNNTEHVLFGVRGSQRTLRRDVPTAFNSNAPRNHSEKPAAFYDMVESMSPGPYLNVFARKHRFNWDAWGNEVYCPPHLPQPRRRNYDP